MPAKARNGYSEAYRFPSGAILMQNPDVERMGTHVIYSAKAIANCENMYDVKQFGLLEYIAKNAKITRLDIRFDYIDHDVDIRALYDEIVSGKHKTRAKSFAYVESAKSGQETGASTCYVGSQKKRKKLLRIYDKGAQTGLDDFWTRYELEFRGGTSQNAANDLLITGEKRRGSKILEMINGYIDLSGTIEAFADIEGVKVSVPKYEKSDTAKWLLTTVAKTLAKECHLDNSLYEQFVHEFAQEFRRLEGTQSN